MKKMLSVLVAGLAAASLFVACDDGGKTNTGSKPNPGPGPGPGPAVVPDNAVRNWTEEDAFMEDEWVIVGVEDIQKLAEIVNLGEGKGGSSFEGKTITLLNDIIINEKVLTDELTEPAEAAPGVPTEGLVNLDSIGRFHKEKDFDVAAYPDAPEVTPFKGTIDGQGHIISGYYSYQGHEGLGFVGYAENAEIRNLIMLDSCVINMNTWFAGENKPIAEGGGDHDGTDDDRFGGLVGYSKGVVIENCVFVGVLGSQVACDRDLVKKYDGPAYEYIGGLIGRCDGKSTATNCLIVAKYYGSGDIVCKKGVENITQSDVVGLPLANYDKAAVEAKIAEIKELLE